MRQTDSGTEREGETEGETDRQWYRERGEGRVKMASRLFGAFLCSRKDVIALLHGRVFITYNLFRGPAQDRPALSFWAVPRQAVL